MQTPCQSDRAAHLALQGNVHEINDLLTLNIRTDCTEDRTLLAMHARSGGSGGGNQAHLQGLDALKASITSDHDGIRPQLQAASRLQGIGCAQPMVRTQRRGQLNGRGAELHNLQIRLCKQGFKTVQAGLIAPPQRRNATLQNAQTADSQCEIRRLNSQLPQGCLGGLGPWGLTIHQVDQDTGLEEGNHQSRSAPSSASISALLRGVVEGGRASSHCNADASALGARDACNCSWR